MLHNPGFWRFIQRPCFPCPLEILEHYENCNYELLLRVNFAYTLPDRSSSANLFLHMWAPYDLLFLHEATNVRRSPHKKDHPSNDIRANRIFLYSFHRVFKPAGVYESCAKAWPLGSISTSQSFFQSVFVLVDSRHSYVYLNDLECTHGDLSKIDKNTCSQVQILQENRSRWGARNRAFQLQGQWWIKSRCETS
jgi:hypothetical protein